MSKTKEIKDMNFYEAIGVLRWNLDQLPPYRNDWEMNSALDRIEELANRSEERLLKEIWKNE